MAAKKKSQATRSASPRDHVLFYLNGERVELRGEEIFLNFSDYLRLRRGLTGTKIVCAEGDCGACTVLRAFPRPGQKDAPDFESVNSCILRVFQLDGTSVVTIEGLGQITEPELHPVQKAMIEAQGSQCGFCTPGFVMALADHFDRKKTCSEEQAKRQLTGNLCRCTGYLPILRAAQQVDGRGIPKLASRFLTPAILRELRSVQKSGILVSHGGLSFAAPATEAELRRLRKARPDSTLIAAGSDLGVAFNKGRLAPQHFLSLHLLPELYVVRSARGRISVGARVTLSEVRRALKKSSRPFADYLNIFASPQIKNFATLVGNVANASPIADTPPALLALDAEVEIFSPSSSSARKRVALAEFYVGYKKIKLAKGELIWAIHFDLPGPKDQIQFSKVSQRRDLDISCVNTGFRASRAGKKTSWNLRLGIGGVGPIPLRLRKTERFLESRGFTEASKLEALKLAQSEIQPISDLRGSANYRRLVAHQLLKKFLADCESAS